ncbi:MAG: xanthine dehydrogenase family protein molybdopterin-binding subunit [Solirubrobacteraceae bacterium]
MTGTTLTPAVGAPLSRIEGREKVTGEARYAYEQPIEGVAYAVAVTSTVATGEITRIDASRALALRGVLAVISHENAPRLAEVGDGELMLFQSPKVAYRGQIVAGVVAESLQTAQEAAAAVALDYDAAPHDVELRPGHPRFYKPEKVNPSFPTDVAHGDLDAGLAAADVVVDATYTTQPIHNNPMEPHASLALWEDGGLTLYDAIQGTWRAHNDIAELFELDPERVRVISHHVGGGFGSKGTPRPQAVLAAIAARIVERPVKIALTRRQLFSMVGYRTPTIQRMRLGAARDGRLRAIGHDAFEQTSTIREFAEQTTIATRHMYAAPDRLTTHRLVALDVPTPSWMRAPGECPGMFALESAMDELAVACEIDPIELRIANEPAEDPEKGIPFSSRSLVACLREGAERFGWTGRDPTPGARRDGRWLVGTGVAASTYPTYRSPSQATARIDADGGFTVQIAAADIGTGARTALTQIAADALGVDAERVRMEIGDSRFGQAALAGGSMGTASWGSAVVKACKALLDQGEGEVIADTAKEVKALSKLSRHAFGAQFVEVRVDTASGEVRLPRVLGVFGVGRVINPKTARSQFIGGMTMGISMALHEESVMDREFGDYLNHDLAQYHVPVSADIQEIDAAWVEEHDDELNPMGSKGIGEIGIVGTAAAVANAVFHATGTRVRDLPIRLDRLVS